MKHDPEGEELSSAAGLSMNKVRLQWTLVIHCEIRRGTQYRAGYFVSKFTSEAELRRVCECQSLTVHGLYMAPPTAFAAGRL